MSEQFPSTAELIAKHELRDRIAKALATRGVSDSDSHWDVLGHDIRATYLADADAVIAALALRVGSLTRYVTEWEND